MNEANPPAHFPRIEQLAEIRHCLNDQQIFAEGEAGHEMFLVIEGSVTITTEGRVVDTLGPGAIFGEMSLVDERPRSATASANGSCRLAVLDREAFTRLVAESPGFALDVMSTMSKRLRNLLVEEVERQRMAESLKIGRDIQLSLLPDACPAVPGWDFSAYYSAAQQVGGDLYDFIIPADASQWFYIVIADVTGKSVPAAIFMASSRSVLRSECSRGRSPGMVLQQTNRFIHMDTITPLLLSAFCARLNVETFEIAYANGGHELPLWYHASSGEVSELRAKGILLGAFSEAFYEEKNVWLEPGDCLLFFTDGITEARNEKDEFFGHERLQQIVASRSWASAYELQSCVVDVLAEFVGDVPASDDLSIVAVRRL